MEKIYEPELNSILQAIKDNNRLILIRGLAGCGLTTLMNQIMIYLRGWKKN